MLRRPLLITPAPFDPRWYSPALWLDASDQSTLFQDRTGASASTPVASDSDPVGTVKDKSGNARHFVAPSDASRPTYKEGVQSGKSGLLYDQINDYLYMPTSTATFNYLHNSAATIFMVAKCGTVANPNVNIALLGNNGGSSASVGYGLTYNDLGPTFNEQVACFVARAGGSVGASTISNLTLQGVASPQTAIIISDFIDATNATASLRSTLKINNGSAANSNNLTNIPSASNATYDLAIGMSGNTGNALYFGGHILEVLIFSSSLAASVSAAIIRWLGSKWGITVA